MQDYSVTKWANERTPGRSEAFITWKGTDVQGDLDCSCGAGIMFDGFFSYFVVCPKCNTAHQLKWLVETREVPVEQAYCVAERIEVDGDEDQWAV